MSRPPISRQTSSPRGTDPELGKTTYFGLRFADLVALSEALARDPSGVPEPGTGRTIAPGIVEIPAKDRGLARTLVEIPALFAHILGEHQSHYAAEAYLGTATQVRNLTLHARRLAYEPDQGVAATGYAVFEVKPELAGTVPKGFALQSEPKGDIKAQTYETLEALEVSDAWNAVMPDLAMVPTEITFDGDLVDLPVASSPGLDPGEVVLLQGGGKSAVCEVVVEAPGLMRLRRLSQGSESTGSWPEFNASAPYEVLCHPDTQLCVFGHNADPVTFPPSAISNPATYPSMQPAAPATAFGYVISGLSEGSYAPGTSLILSEPMPPQEPDAPIALVGASTAAPYAVNNAREAAVTFQRGQLVPIPQPADAPADFPTEQLIRQTFSARAGLLDLRSPGGSVVTWGQLPLDAVIYADWQTRVPVVARQPNAAPFTATAEFAADLSGIRPGRTIILERISDGFAASATILRLAARGDALWELVLSLDDGIPASGFALGDMMLRFNVGRVSHGETKSEILGASDGVTPHQSFTLKKQGVTRIPGPQGGTPELDVRVDGVLWDRVTDFHYSTPEDRHYKTEAGADQTLSVVFGGENRAAVPPSGTRNITAEYRIGNGQVGDVGAGRLTRIRKASPLLKSVSNPLPLYGGTDPASPDEIRRQATRPILTFDRAVSLQDYADLALLFPGVARASARWLDRGAIELIAADANGGAVADQTALRAFLDARRDTELPMVLLAPQPVDICVTLRVERNAAWLADAVRAEVIDALLSDDRVAPGMFTFAGRAFSAPQSLSGLYARLLEREAISGVEATCFDILPDTGVTDIIHATDRQWLRLSPNNLTVEMVEPGALIPDVEEGSV